ncbi:MAG: hypothetical protein V2A73_16970 [Pseudomonadota bacterium]
MADLCEIADVAAFLQITIAAGSAAAARAITEASAAIRNYCHQTIDEVEDDDYTFDVEGSVRKLFLPELPVTAITEVVENGETLTVDDDYKLGRWGILHRVSAYWYPGVQTVTVTYTHGRAAIPDDVKSVCVRAAARAYQAGLSASALAGVSGVQSQGIGDYSVAYGSQTSGSDGMLGASAAPILLPSEKALLNEYRYRGA